MLKFLRLSPDAILPSRSTPRSSGLDLCAVLPPGQGRLTLPPGERARVGTGWAVELPVGTEGQIRPRSGLAFKKGLTVLNAPGTIDEDYRGELMVLLINHGDCNVCITPGMKIAQLVVGSVRTIDIPVEVQDEPALTERGARGFGSTEETALTQLPARAYAEFLTERSVRTFSPRPACLARSRARVPRQRRTSSAPIPRHVDIRRRCWTRDLQLPRRCPRHHHGPQRRRRS
jgi:dUTP pyrophosphatase